MLGKVAIVSVDGTQNPGVDVETHQRNLHRLSSSCHHTDRLMEETFIGHCYCCQEGATNTVFLSLSSAKTI